MGINIKVVGADYSANARKFLPPRPENLEYIGFFGDDSVRCRRNYAIGKDPAVVSGTPVHSNGYSRFTPNLHYVNSGLIQSENMTLITVARAKTNESSIYMGNKDSPRIGGVGNSSGISLQFAAGPTPGKMNAVFSCSQWDGVSSATQQRTASIIDSVDVDEWAFMAGVNNTATDQGLVYNLTKGTNAAVTFTQQTDIGATPLRVGSSTFPNASFDGPVDIAFAAMYSAALPFGEIDALYQKIKAFMATRGITI